MNLNGTIGAALLGRAKDLAFKSTGGEDSKQLKDLKKACEQFESVFAKKLLSEMRKGVQEVQLGDGAGSAIYKDMMDQALADAMAKQGALGIGKMLYRQFEKQVGATPSSPNTPSANLDNQARSFRKTGNDL